MCAGRVTRFRYCCGICIASLIVLSALSRFIVREGLNIAVVYCCWRAFAIIWERLTDLDYYTDCLPRWLGYELLSAVVAGFF